jgi:hypothetical protein
LALSAADSTSEGSSKEVKHAARTDLAADGAVLLLKKLSTALEQVHSSSDALGSALYRAIGVLVPHRRAVRCRIRARSVA